MMLQRMRRNLTVPRDMEGVISIWNLICWSLHFFQPFSILSSNASSTKEEGVTSTATLLACIASHPDVCRLFVLNGPLETIYKCWMFLGRTYSSWELIIGILSVVHNDSSLSPIGTILTRELEQVSEIILRSLVVDIQRPSISTNFEYLVHSFDPLAALSEASNDISRIMVAATPRICRAIDHIVSQCEPLSSDYDYELSAAMRCLDLVFAARDIFVFHLHRSHCM
ncbi:hypothetical protein EDD85DRAFT_122919 [Armillaria nabsnona]|nr:hypothetical protein EDD85DRAFT_122919 [Armillaria nabsnona]